MQSEQRAAGLAKPLLKLAQNDSGQPTALSGAGRSVCTAFFFLSPEIFNQFRVSAELVFTDLVTDRLVGHAFGAVNRLQCKMIGKPPFEPPQTCEHIPPCVLPNVSDMVLAQKIFARFLSLFEPALVLWVALHVMPETGVIH